jgi:hypothetical protein
MISGFIELHNFSWHMIIYESTCIVGITLILCFSVTVSYFFQKFRFFIFLYYLSQYTEFVLSIGDYDVKLKVSHALCEVQESG